MRRYSKYHVDLSPVGKLERTYKGVTYHSKAEARYAQHLDILASTGYVSSWERQTPRIKLYSQSGLLICTYVPDFTVHYADGHTEVVDVKGKETDGFKLKLKWANADWFPAHPEYGTGVRVVKAVDF